MTPEFETLATLHGLSLNKNQHNYLDPKTQLAYIFWNSSRNYKQDEIYQLKQELCDMTFAANAYKHLLENKK
jgi:hypothetical protein